jgi:hypothetical protein
MIKHRVCRSSRVRSVMDFADEISAMANFIAQNPDTVFRFFILVDELWLIEFTGPNMKFELGGCSWGATDLVSDDIESPEQAVRVAWEIWYRYDFPHTNYED